MSIVKGVPISYLSFDGVNDYVSFNNRFTEINKNSDFKIELEIKFLRFGPNQETYFTTANGSSDRWSFHYNQTTDRLVFTNYPGSFPANAAGIDVSSNNIQTGVWYNVTLEYINGTVFGDISGTSWQSGTDDYGSVQGDFPNPKLGARLDSADLNGNFEIRQLNIYNGSNVLTHEYNFDEGSGTTLTDSVGNNDATIVGATWQSEANAIQNIYYGKPSYSLSFDGVNDSINLGKDPFNSSNNIAVEFEVAFEGSTTQYIFGQLKNLDERFRVQFRPDYDEISVSIGNYTVDTTESYTVTNVPFSFMQQKNKYKVVYNDGDSQFFINDVEQLPLDYFRDSGSSGSVGPFAYDFLFGAQTFDGTTDYANIELYSLKIYTDDELYSHYDFSGSGTTLKDLQGNNDATIDGATWSNTPLSTNVVEVPRIYLGQTLVYGALAFTPISATGGTIQDVIIDGYEYRIHAFTDTGSDTFTVNDAGSDGLVDVLIVAGGGGGGDNSADQTGTQAGGGGAGGLILETFNLSQTNYTIEVGSGGSGSTNREGDNGNNSTAFGFTAIGGGGGGVRSNALNTQQDGSNGGSGGGAGFDGFGGTSLQTSSSSGGFGNDGGGNGDGSGSGGGGATQPGENGPLDNDSGGDGGDGLFVSWADAVGYGENGYFAGGGGGGGDTTSIRGLGGLGGGGNGGIPNARGDNGLANTGGGGGGSANDDSISGGDGGSGIVLIRYPLEEVSITITSVEPVDIYNLGTTNTDLIGGWDLEDSGGYTQFNSDHIRIGGSSAYGDDKIRSQLPIDTTDYTKLYVDVELVSLGNPTNSSSYTQRGLARGNLLSEDSETYDSVEIYFMANENPQGSSSDVFVFRNAEQIYGERQIVELDITGLDNLYTLYFNAGNGGGFGASGTSEQKIYKIWME